MANILVVDDHPTSRKFLVTLLGYMGHRLVEASDGSEALELVRRDRPDLAIVDVVMPNMNGYEFASQVPSEPNLAATPIILHSAVYREHEVQPLAIACGVPYVLSMPAEPDKILRIVSEVLGADKAQ
ncbi:MAG TPA: response regulator [Pirellulales bacterium]|nr:response regulator [Pirellulales bacterium]